MSKVFRKIAVVGMLTLFVGGIVLASLSYPSRVQAQPIPGLDAAIDSAMGPMMGAMGGVGEAVGGAAAVVIPTSQISSLPSTLDKILTQIREGMKVATLNAAIGFMQYFMQKLAYDTAVYIAAGGKGQKPLLFTKNAADYFAATANEAAGKAIDSFADFSGLSLCTIPNINIDAAIKIGLKQKYVQPTKPTCTFTDMISNWGDSEAWKSKYGQNPLDTLNHAISVEDSQLGIAMTAKIKMDRLLAQKTEGARVDREEGKGAKGVVGIISGNIKTPGNVVSKRIEDLAKKKSGDMTWNNFTNILGAGTYQVIPYAMSTFFNTLLSQGLKNILADGLFPDSDDDNSNTDEDVFTYDSFAGTGGRRRAEQMFSDILMTTIKPIEKYNLLAELGNCPDSTRGMYNCTADTGLVQAVQQAGLTKPITIKEAIAKNWLHGSWKLIPPANTTDNTSKNCYNRAYCYSNIKKLRLANILPLGFEIAAKNSNPDIPWTLKQVIDGFNDCNFASNGTVVPDSKNKPFCRLIDPDWVLKVPPIRCNAMGYTNSLLSTETSERMQECVDMTTCVGYDSSGNCVSYGHCTRSKNTWKVDGQQCDAQYNTCITFKDSEKKTVSYLYSTLDTKNCNADNIGCTAYSLDMKKGINTTTMYWQGISQSQIKNLKEKDIPISTVHLNKNVISCKSEGCSKFLPARTIYGSDPFYIKKAPNYLNCYDVDPNEPGIQWPRTRADLKRLNGDASCANFAQVCLPQEENCNWYTEVSSQRQIPGRFKPGEYIDVGGGESAFAWNNQCHQSCNGYDTYQEMPGSYSSGQSLAYIVPSSGTQCSNQEVGCTSFTNLATSTDSIETVEYYSYLRPCIKPDPSKQKTYYTYEGSGYAGYQLKVYQLEEDLSSGAPKYFYRKLDDLKDYDSVCNEALYKIGSKNLDPDCRQFNDKDGKTYYALLQKTIAVDKQCTPYRLNNTDTYALDDITVSTASQCTARDGFFTKKAGDSQAKCYVCYQNGVYKDGYCYYNGLPSNTNNSAGNSLSCSSDKESCLAYKGNSANNIQMVVLNSGSYSKIDNFENSNDKIDLEDWTAGVNTSISVSKESTRSGEHSLGATSVSSNGFVTKQISIKSGEGYSLNFWIKGSKNNFVDVSLKGSNISFGTIAIKDNWQYIKLGPKDVSKTTTNTADLLMFTIKDAGSIYIDNLEVTKINQYLYLVKNSLSVPAVCDDNQNDNLPGQALGCTAYSVTNQSTKTKNTVYLTGFDYLCRSNAIGCTPLLDTYNTNDTEPTLFNVKLLGASGSKASLRVGQNDESCQVRIGDDGCYVKDIVGFTPSGLLGEAKGKVAITSSTVYVPEDTSTSSPIFLVVDASATCHESEKGCVGAGKEKKTPKGSTYEKVLIKNDPEKYSTLLCQEEGIGCGSYSSTAGNLYFKDPLVVGQKICSYKKGVTVQGAKYSGWFWKGVGVCGSVTKTLTSQTIKEAPTKQFCSTDKDCAGIKDYNQCVNKDTHACYPNYLKSGLEFGLWPFGTKDKYQGFVGECPAQQNGCTEFLDPNDKNKAHYYVNDDKIKTAKNSCEGGASIKNGCVLFNQTNQPTKTWNAALTYAASKAKNYNQVTPISHQDVKNNDANIVMKVIRDRECGEWLSCRTNQRVYDKANNIYKNICYQIGRCDESSKTGEQGGLQNCTNWIDGNHDYAGQVLTDYSYIRRPVDWNSFDYTGMSILNMYPIEELTQVNTSNSGDNWRLVKQIACGTNSNKSKAVCNPLYPNSPTCKTNMEGENCGYDNSGTCVNGLCVKNPQGNSKSPTANTYQMACRAFPEKDSPYPNTFTLGKSNNFTKVNICSESKAQFTSKDEEAFGCDCAYTKVAYGINALKSKYWSYDKPNKNGFGGSIAETIPTGICSGGIYDGVKECTNLTVSQDCGASATCAVATRQSNLVGWQGYCLEPDVSRLAYGERSQYECLAWYPVDVLGGAADIYSTPEAGYIAGPNGKYYCMQAKGNLVERGSAKEEKQFKNNYCTSIKSLISAECIYSDANSWHFKPLDYYHLPIMKTRVGFDDVNKWKEKWSSPMKENFPNVSPDPTDELFDNVLTRDKGTNIILNQTYVIQNKPNSIGDQLKSWGNHLNYGDQFINKDYYKYTIPTYGSYIAVEKKNKLYLSDIDYAMISLTADGNLGKNELPPPTSAANQYFLIRNNYQKDISKQVTTVYDTTSGCKVSQVSQGSIEKVNPYTTSNNSEKCFDKFEMDLRQTSVANSQSLVKTETKKVKSQVDGKEYYIMRLISDDRHACDNVPLVNYTDTGLGFFPEWGDKSTNYNSKTDAGRNGRFTCSGHTDDKSGCQDVVEVIMVFDGKTGEYIDSGAAFCTTDADSSADEVLFDIHLSVRMREYCTAIAQVSDKTDNAAWTDRIWSGSKYDMSYSNKIGYDVGVPYKYALQANPFGSLAISLPKETAIIYSSRQDSYSGVPYSSLGKTADFSQTKDLPLTKNDSKAVNWDVSGSNKSNSFYTATETLVKSYHFIKNLFAKVDKVFKLNPESYGMATGKDYTPKSSDAGASLGSTYDIDGFSDSYGVYNLTEKINISGGLKPYQHAPKIFSVDCLDPDTCYQSKEGITLNDKMEGDVELKTNPGVVVLKFFAQADPNQMPIKRIKVDWDDNTDTVVNGSYRNKMGKVKGKCDTTTKKCTIIAPKLDNILSQSLSPNMGEYKYNYVFETDESCKRDLDCEGIDQCMSESDAPNFGQIEDKTCDNDYYLYSHVYHCVQGSPGYETALSGNCPTGFEKGCCIYNPRVQVKDSWGWSNGYCPKVPKYEKNSPGGDGCYDRKQLNENKYADETQDSVETHVDGNSPWTLTKTIRIIATPK